MTVFLAPTLTTDRLTLRTPDPADWPAYCACRLSVRDWDAAFPGEGPCLVYRHPTMGVAQ